MKARLAGIELILLVALAVFSLSLLNGFVWDDWVYMVPNPVYLEFDLRGMLLGTANSVEYLPVRDLSIALDAAVWGMRPFGFHLSNLVYYLASLVFLHRAVMRLGTLLGSERPGAAAFWATLIFAVHPLHAEVVNFVGARNSILAGLFLFLALDQLLKGMQENRALPIWVSLLAYGLALFSKAIVVFFPVLLVALFLVLPARSVSLRTRALIMAGFIALTAAAVALHLYLAADSSVANERMLRLGIDNPWFQFRKALLIALFYVRMTLAPWPLSVDYPDGFILHGSWLFVALAAALVLASLAVFWKTRQGKPFLALAVAWFFIALLPVLNFVPTHPLVADRYAYLPVLGFAMVIAHWVNRTANNQKLWLVTLVVVIIGASSVSVFRTLDWRTDLHLWKSAIEAHPQTGRVEFAQALWRRERYLEALEQLRIEKDLTGSHYYSYYAGGYAMMEGQTDRAIAFFEAALAEGGDAYSDVHLKLAEAYEQAGETELALEHYLKTLQTENMDIFGKDRIAAQSAIDRIWNTLEPAFEAVKNDALSDPDDFKKAAEAAVFFYNIGKYEEAKTFYLRALKLRPSSWEAWHNLGLTYMKTREYNRAIDAFKSVLRHNSSNTNTLNQLAICYNKIDRQDLSIRTYRQALEIDPTFFDAVFNLGVIYFSQGDLENSRRNLLHARSLTAIDDPRRQRIDVYLRQISSN